MNTVPLLPIEKFSLLLNVEPSVLLKKSLEEIVLMLEEKNINPRAFIKDIKELTQSEPHCY